MDPNNVMSERQSQKIEFLRYHQMSKNPWCLGHNLALYKDEKYNKPFYGTQSLFLEYSTLRNGTKDPGLVWWGLVGMNQPSTLLWSCI